MPYTVKSSEALRKKASDTETKALLYLMNFRDDSDDIYYFVVDFFNDITGLDRFSTKLWDVQSKGVKDPSPKNVGSELVTLFKNYYSDFEFHKYILFMSSVSRTLRKDNSIYIFDISNIKDESKHKLKQGLIEACLSKNYIDYSKVNDLLIDDFLTRVLFVVDNRNSVDYVKQIIRSDISTIPNDIILQGIFNEIRDMQASKKNIKNVENITIECSNQALNYYRHLTSSEIKLFVLSRIINRDPLSKGCPIPFIHIFNEFPDEKKQDALEDFKMALSRVLFNKNNSDNFWKLFSRIYFEIKNQRNCTVESIYNNLEMELIESCPDFDVLSLKYFIATVMEGIQS